MQDERKPLQQESSPVRRTRMQTYHSQIPPEPYIADQAPEMPLPDAPQYCPRCGNPAAAAQRFCGVCGRALHSADPLKPVVPGKGLGIAGMVLGIIGLVICWVPFLGLLFLLPAFVMGILARKKGCRGQSTAAIVCSTIGLIVQLVLLAIILITMITTSTVNTNIQVIKEIPAPANRYITEAYPLP